MRPASIALRAALRSIFCCAVEGGWAPPEKKFAPRTGSCSPYCAAVKPPMVAHPGTGTGLPSLEAAPSSAPALTTRLPLGNAPAAGPTARDATRRSAATSSFRTWLIVPLVGLVDAPFAALLHKRVGGRDRSDVRTHHDGRLRPGDLDRAELEVVLRVARLLERLHEIGAALLTGVAEEGLVVEELVGHGFAVALEGPAQDRVLDSLLRAGQLGLVRAAAAAGDHEGRERGRESLLHARQGRSPPGERHPPRG